jgi:hypothetical protein
MKKLLFSLLILGSLALYGNKYFIKDTNSNEEIILEEEIEIEEWMINTESWGI